jgi:hypothetical protein
MRAHHVAAGLLEFPPRIGVCPSGSIGRPVGFPVGVLSKSGAVTDGWGGSEASLRELALSGDEFVDDLALSHQ